MHTIVLSIDHLKLVRDSRVIVRTDSFNIAGRHVALPFSLPLPRSHFAIRET